MGSQFFVSLTNNTKLQKHEKDCFTDHSDDHLLRNIQGPSLQWSYRQRFKDLFHIAGHESSIPSVPNKKQLELHEAGYQNWSDMDGPVFSGVLKEHIYLDS